MTEYNGTIDLISGLRPKNNGDFPLMQAKDVLMPDGSRLSEMIVSWPDETKTASSLHMESTLTVRACAAVIGLPAVSDASDTVRIDAISVKTLADATGRVRFAMCRLVDNGDGTGVLTSIATLGVATASDGLATLNLDDGYIYDPHDYSLYVMAFAEDDIIEGRKFSETSITMAAFPNFANETWAEDAQIECEILTDGIYAISSDTYTIIKHQPISNFTQFVYDKIKAAEESVNSYPIVDASTTEIPSIADGKVKAISPEKYYVFGEVDSLVVCLIEPDDGKMHEFCLEFIPSSNFEGFDVYGDCKWATDIQCTAGKTCQVSIMNGIGVMISA